MYILYAFQVQHEKVALDPNKIMNIENFKFCFYFCLQYVLSRTISLQKIIPKMLFMGFYCKKYTCYFS